MDNSLIVGLVVVGMLTLLLIGMPVAFVLAFAGAAGFWSFSGDRAALGILKVVPLNSIGEYVLITIPLFVLMSEFLNATGITDELVETSNRLLRRMPGGLAFSTLLACAGFSAVCGSSVVCAASVGRAVIPQMLKIGYSRRLTAGAVCAGGLLAVMIPPSTPLVVYGIITETSIGQLFVAGIVPGVVLALMFAIVAAVWIVVNPLSKGSQADLQGPIIGYRVIFRGVIPTIMLVIIVLGGLYTGVFTATEAAAVGAFTAMVICAARGNLTLSALKKALNSTAEITCMITAIMMGAMILGYFLSGSQLPQKSAAFVTGLALSPALVMLLIGAAYLILGMFLDGAALLLLTVPILFPIVTALGYNPVWFGIMVVVAIEMGMLTPPVALVVFVVSSLYPEDLPLPEVVRGSLPFLLAAMAMWIMLIAFPQIALWLPATMK